MYHIASSDWHLYGLGSPTSQTSTNSSTEQEDPEDTDIDVADNGVADVGVDANVQRPNEAVTPMPTAAGAAPLQPLVTSAPAILTGLSTSHNIPPLSDTLPDDPLLPSPTGESMEIPSANQDQGFPNLEVPDGLNRPVLSRENDILLAGIEDLPMDATGSGWMKSKKTLQYFRQVHKTGKLSELILHWY